MSEKIMKTRIIHKHDIEENWEKAINFIPKQGEIIVYDSDDIYGYERIKIGDGKTVVSNLPFMADEIKNEIKAYINQVLYGIIDGTIKTIDNDKALYVRDYGFYKHQSLNSVNFSIATNIGDYSFYKCPTLTSANVPLAINIGVFAFKGCSSITTANYPLVTSIGQGAFDECVNLSSVNLPMLENVAPLTFRNCESLNILDLPVVTTISTQAFYNSGITSLTLQADTVITLENEDAFYFTPIENGTGYIYVKSHLVDMYKTANGWSTYANQIRAIA